LGRSGYEGEGGGGLLPESRTSTMANLFLSLVLISRDVVASLLVLVLAAFESRSEERASLLIRGMEAIVIEDMLPRGGMRRGG
jgi:hypothetical protein